MERQSLQVVMSALQEAIAKKKREFHRASSGVFDE